MAVPVTAGSRAAPCLRIETPLSPSIPSNFDSEPPARGAGGSAAQQAARVTVGVPVFNGARFLPLALESLLGQTFTAIEIVISDNASTDDTQSIAESFVRRDARIRYVRQPKNIGAPRNWNFVATQARTDYFKWATANDEVAPRMLELCVAALDADPTAVLSQGVTCLVDECSGARQTYDRDLALPDETPSQRLRRLCLDLALNNGQGGLIRTSALQRTRLERVYPGGDIALMAELALLGKFVVLPETLLYRRMGPNTFSRALADSKLSEFYDPGNARIGASGVWNEHLDLLRSVAQSPIAIGERARALAFVLRRMAWDRDRIWHGLMQRVGRH